MCRFTALGLVVLALAAVPVFAADHVVVVGGAAGLVFTPSQLTINAGDTVTFTNAGGHHNVTSDIASVTAFHCSDACGDSPIGDPSSTAWSATVTFPTAGSAPYHCQQHGSDGSGMAGTITIVDDVVFVDGFDG